MKKLSNYLDNKKVILAILLIVSILTLLICSKNSPLCPYNDWVDGNAFFTMGKGMFNGKVPYKDLFEQKGLLLYLIYGIGYLISHDTFLGVYLLEVISYTIFGYFLFKIARTYLNQFYYKHAKWAHRHQFLLARTQPLQSVLACWDCCYLSRVTARWLAKFLLGWL